MARRSSIRLLAAVADRPIDDVVRLVGATLVLVVATAVVSLPTDGKSASWTALWSTLTASMRSLPAAAGVGPQLLDPKEASRANDDGYLEGLSKALGHDL
jgi:hypothetical protein